MVVAVVVVASVAAVISYADIRDLVLLYGGEGHFIAAIFALCIDGMILASNLTLLFCARYRIDPPALAYLTLWAGIITTLAANISHGLTYSAGAALIEAWPPLAYYLASELLWWVVQTSRELDAKRTVIVVDRPQGQNANELTKVAEIIANDHDVSSAEIARRLDLPYPKVLKLTKDARRLLNGSHLSVIG